VPGTSGSNVMLTWKDAVGTVVAAGTSTQNLGASVKCVADGEVLSCQMSCAYGIGLPGGGDCHPGDCP